MLNGWIAFSIFLVTWLALGALAFRSRISELRRRRVIRARLGIGP